MSENFLLQVAQLTELLSDDTPYALLAVLLIFVMFMLIKFFRMTDDKDKAKYWVNVTVFSFFSLGLFSLGGYMVYSWSQEKILQQEAIKLKTITGSFGVLNERHNMLSTDDEMYIAAEAKANQNKWKYAIVTKDPKVCKDGNECYEFVIQWNHCTPTSAESCDVDEIDYYIPEHLLYKYINFVARKDGSEFKLFYDDPTTEAQDWVEYTFLPRPISDSITGLFTSWWSAYASEHEHNFDDYVKGLNSSNSYERANTRKQLRRLSQDELKALSGDPRLSDNSRKQVLRILKQYLQ